MAKNKKTNWEVARYLIDAKKEVDSLWFIAVNQSKINGNIKRLVELRRNTFYINAAAVVDEFVGIKTDGMSNKEIKNFKHSLQESNRIIKLLYYYRDKHAAHKDSEFRDTDFPFLMDITRECMSILEEVRIVCADVLPENITLDFVCYDAELFRFIYKIDKDLEYEILKSKHPLITKNPPISNPMKKKVFHDTEDIWKVTNPTEYATILYYGLGFEEGIQNRQDFCIKTNVLHKTDIWVQQNNEKYRSCLMMIKLGYIDIFNRPICVNKSKHEQLQDMVLIDNASKYTVYNLQIDDAKIMEAIYGQP